MPAGASSDPLASGGAEPLTLASRLTALAIGSIGWGPRAPTDAIGREAHGGEESPLAPPSDDEGVERIVADPDSPTSRLLEQAARRSLPASQHGTPTKVCVPVCARGLSELFSNLA